MVRKTAIEIQKNLIFLILVLFPFGQLPGFLISKILVSSIKIHPLDLLVFLLSASFFISRHKTFPLWFSKGLNLLVVALFSLLISLCFFHLQELRVGFLYLVRFFSYILSSYIIWELVSKGDIDRKLILNSLISIGIFVAIFGLLQYVFFPDLRTLKLFGWDDHYFRLVSTFLDPAFSGIILVLAFILSIFNFKERRNLFSFFLPILFTITLAFTYSRSSFLALLVGVLMFLHYFPKEKFCLLFLALFLLFVIFLPRPAGEGVRLERTSSVFMKIENYSQSFLIIGKSPLFGIGYNNICLAKNKFLPHRVPSINSCNGLDNSFLFILATMGMIGFIFFIAYLAVLVRSSSNNIYGKIFRISGASLLIHSLFTNTLFYAWSMVWFSFLIAISRDSKKRN